jgi:hypothetical protein
VSEKACCENCKYYYSVSRECRKRAPSVVNRDREKWGCEFPNINGSQWCGDFKNKSSKTKKWWEFWK